MQPFTDETIVLGKKNSGDADRIITVLTKEHGKIGVLIKGGQKATSKLGQGTDLFSYSRMRVVPGKTALYILTDTTRIGEPFSGIDLPHIQALSAIVEVVDHMSELSQPINATVFELVRLSLQHAYQSLEPFKSVILFIDRFMRYMGFGLEVRSCVECGEALKPEITKVDVKNGGVVCSHCYGSDGIQISVSTLKILRLLEQGEYQKFFLLELPTLCQRELSTVFLTLLQIHSGRRFTAVPKALL